MAGMSGTFYSLMSYLLPMLAILLGALEIWIALLLWREKGPGPKVMLAGALMGILGNLSGPVVLFLASPGKFNEAAYTAAWSLATLGAMMFTIGLLLHALHRRSLSSRIRELETILASRSQD